MSYTVHDGNNAREYVYLVSMWQSRVFNEVVSPDTGPVVHGVTFLVHNLVSLGDHSASSSHTIAQPLSQQPSDLSPKRSLVMIKCGAVDDVCFPYA